MNCAIILRAGVMTTGDVCTKYLKESNMMFIGGVMVAIAVEHCNLHKRIALRALLAFGTSPRLYDCTCQVWGNILSDKNICEKIVLDIDNKNSILT